LAVASVCWAVGSHWEDVRSCRAPHGVEVDGIVTQQLLRLRRSFVYPSTHISSSLHFQHAAIAMARGRRL
jgi:hypothetical protein